MKFAIVALMAPCLAFQTQDSMMLKDQLASLLEVVQAIKS